MREEITGVAARNRHSGDIIALPRPARHADLVSLARDLREAWIDYDEGFIAGPFEHKRFVSRSEGYKIAHASGQIIYRALTPGTLYSEDLW